SSRRSICSSSRGAPGASGSTIPSRSSRASSLTVHPLSPWAIVASPCALEDRLARIPLAALALGLLVAGAAAAAVPDWEALRDVGTVVVATTDADGSARETTVWLAVVDGAGYVRTGSTRWGDNAVRNGELVLQVERASYPLRIELVEDEAVRQRVS